MSQDPNTPDTLDLRFIRVANRYGLTADQRRSVWRNVQQVAEEHLAAYKLYVAATELARLAERLGSSVAEISPEDYIALHDLREQCGQEIAKFRLRC